MDLSVSAPGRICLFGEHQDYLNLGVIPCAINLRTFIEGRIFGKRIKVESVNIKSKGEFSLDKKIVYSKNWLDYIKAVVSVIKKRRL